ncbi:hypothetical protein NDU88_002537 [Pleurodeles waltl]|uniref:Uncharacterized protein n=1 Tax=Pleurodeles waltl TaxID=8319 RepID=A0AAV7KWC9_PLEWA|nr:hypothetical protein NDU88_002537 [Pleurodeles waltl]
MDVIIRVDACNGSPVTRLRLAKKVAGATTDGFAEKYPGGTSTRKGPLTSERFRGQVVRKQPDNAKRQQQEERVDVRQEEDTEVKEEAEREENRVAEEDRERSVAESEQRGKPSAEKDETPEAKSDRDHPRGEMT